MNRYFKLAAAVALLFAGIASTQAISFTPVFTFDPNTTPTVRQQQQQATTDALNNLAKYFQPSNITLRVDFKFHDLGNTGTLGQAGPAGFDVRNGVYFAQALFNLLAKNDVNGGAVSLNVEMNTNASVTWFYGASTPPQGQYNWQSVIMHEVGHSMGFFDTVAQNGSYSNAGPGIFETISTLGVGGSVLSSLDQAGRAQAVISNNVYWSGQFGLSANNGQAIKLYSPNPYEEGSNYSHLDPSQTGVGGLYFPSLPDATFFAGPTKQELGILHDVGWRTSPFEVQLVNISTRVVIGTGDQVGIAGFIVRGNNQKRVLIRGIGPSLQVAGVNGALSNPVLELRDSSGGLIISNDDWQSAPEAGEITASGAAPSNNLESAIIRTLNAGASYTAILKGSGDATGIGLVEVYDLAVNSGPDLANISTRGNVSTGDNIMIAGLIVQGVNQQTFVARGIGPSLTAAGVIGALADPTLEIRNSQGALLMANDNWKDDSSQAAALQQANIAPTRDEESAIIVNVPAGIYTALLRGKDNTTGVGLIEIYNLARIAAANPAEAETVDKPKPLNPAGLRW
ncbi:MAG: hypothetical protein M3Q94_03880 [Pseudomonadota bacterium]|nr:hypothetical protein [Pseudomonadota bacterium]